MFLEPIQYALGVLSGSVVGLSLGLFGGGGSILAVPLLVYLVGVPNAHMAIGTSAVSVAANAVTGLAGHARNGTVNWRCAAVYSVAGVLGAFFGSSLGKAIDGRHLLLLFAGLMLVVGALMFRRRSVAGDPAAVCTRENAPKVLGFGGGTGLLSGFFGIGGGFLIVPGLVASTGMPMINAIGSSLVAVTALGLTTAISYAFSGMVDWPLASAFIAGGLLGGLGGSRAALVLQRRKGALNVLFALMIVAVAGYMIWRNLA
ncbi:sulfite exporter TauE/SafE family protein [Aminobacter sp. BE322]|uniref:sulfite exporter TauE/SafE family protein n=1 Tax=unclassified Aminobacter TaxID=2644704 RepID=UPI003D22968C